MESSGPQFSLACRLCLAIEVDYCHPLYLGLGGGGGGPRGLQLVTAGGRGLPVAVSPTSQRDTQPRAGGPTRAPPAVSEDARRGHDATSPP
eukprot:scaffold210273_cov50-Prasinocladus_malaysianus.AAC.1